MSTKPVSICSKCDWPDTFDVYNKDEETFICNNCGSVEHATDIEVLDPKDILIKNLVAFCILMQNGEGIVSKSPEYILEKFNKYLDSNNPTWYWGLDADNKNILSNYIARWRRSFKRS